MELKSHSVNIVPYDTGHCLEGNQGGACWIRHVIYCPYIYTYMYVYVYVDCMLIHIYTYLGSNHCCCYDISE